MPIAKLEPLCRRRMRRAERAADEHQRLIDQIIELEGIEAALRLCGAR